MATRAKIVSAILMLAVGTTACASLLASRANAPVAAPAPAELPDEARLDVAIVVFDPGLPEDGDLPERVYANIRHAESKVFPQDLRTTLQQTGHWGLVVVVPAEPTSADLTVTGKIHNSDGQQLLLDIHVQDSSGREWLDKTYKSEPTDAAYDDEEGDPYQSMYNTIANDLVSRRSRLKPDELEDVSTITDLRFASRLAPDAFEGYLASKDGKTYTIRRLPALGDPMMERILEVKQRDEMFIGALDAHYENFTRTVRGSYRHWRDSAREETLARKALAREQQMRAVATIFALAATAAAASNNSGAASDAIVAAGAVIIANQVQKIQQLGQEKEIHQAALAELDESFEAEVTPMVVDLDGTTHRLTGTAESQYAEWQRLLGKLYEAETGMLSSITLEMEQPDPEPEAFEEPVAEEAGMEAPEAAQAIEDYPLPPVSAPANPEQ